jgi:hypothetical protein
MRTSCPTRRVSATLLAAALLGVPPAAAQQLVISEARQDCIPRTPYPVLDAVVRPAEQVAAAWLHFRAAQSPTFHWLRMSATGGRFEAILPAPSRETREVVYFVEAAAVGAEPVRTELYTARVVDDEQGCDDEPAGIFRGEPRIVVAGPPGAPPVPAGFAPSGIVGAVAERRGAVLLPWLAVLGFGGIVFALEEDADEDRPVSPTTP